MMATMISTRRCLMSKRFRTNITPTARSIIARNINSTTSNAASETKEKTKSPLCWLDLRGSGLSVLERLCLEETLLKHDDRNWMCVGSHVPTPHRYLQKVPTTPAYMAAANHQQQQEDHNTTNTSCCVVMGIGGKPAELLNVPQVRMDGVWVIKRFSGGGTVVVDHNSIWTTLIGRTQMLTHVEPFPRSIMAYTATILEPAWKDLRLQQQQAAAKSTSKSSPMTLKPTMVLDTKSCAIENTGLLIQIPDTNANDKKNYANLQFALRENDYVLGDWKMAGNAQSIVKEGWLHHTSFLWDYDEENMEYLTMPSRRPDYRRQRNHGDFLIKLQPVLHPLKPRDFLASLQRACQNEFQVQAVTLRDAMEVVHQAFGSMDGCLAKSRNRVMDLTDAEGQTR